MSIEGSVTFNINGNVNQAAARIVNKDTHVGDVHHNGDLPSVKAILDRIAASVPPEAQEDTLAPIRSLTELPAEEQASEEKKQESLNLWQRLAPYRSQIIKGVAAFGEAALSAVASSHPALIGLLALIRAVKPDESDDEA